MAQGEQYLYHLVTQISQPQTVTPYIRNSNIGMHVENIAGVNPLVNNTQLSIQSINNQRVYYATRVCVVVHQ